MRYNRGMLEKAEWSELFSCYHRKTSLLTSEKYDIPTGITHIKDVDVPTGLYIGMEYIDGLGEMKGLFLVSESKLKRFWLIDDQGYMKICKEIKNYIDGGMSLDQVYTMVGL